MFINQRINNRILFHAYKEMLFGDKKKKQKKHNEVLANTVNTNASQIIIVNGKSQALKIYIARFHFVFKRSSVTGKSNL